MTCSPRVALTATALGVLTGLVACGGDDEVVIDAAVQPDSGPDAENLCPGKLTWTALVANLDSGAPEFAVSVAEEGDEANATTSAPNGRAVLCLPADAPSTVRATKTDYVPLLEAVQPAAVDLVNQGGQGVPLGVLTTAGADALFDDLSLTRDGGDTQVVVSVLSYPDATPLEGATVELDKTYEAAEARQAGGGYVEGAAVQDGGWILFANTLLTGGADDGAVVVTVTPPDAFEGTCVGPATATLEAGSFTGLLFACH